MVSLESRYQRAEQLLPWNLVPRLTNLSVEPYWLDEYRFWFKRDLCDQKQGYEFILVDTDSVTETLAFDHQRVANALSELLGTTVKPDQLPLDTLLFCSTSRIRVTLKHSFAPVEPVEIDLESYDYKVETYPAPKTSATSRLEENDPLPILSPDGRYQVVYQHHNLILRERATGMDTPLTEDGEAHYGYGTCSAHMNIGICEKKIPPLTVLWSHDGRYLAVQRIDERQVKTMPLLQSVPEHGDLRPINQPYKLAMPGDDHEAMASLYIFEIETGDAIVSDRPSMPASSGGFIEMGALQWGADNVVYHTEWTRDKQEIRLIAFDPTATSSRVLVEEINTEHSYLHPGPMPYEPTVFKVLPEINEFIWYSHSSGWGHLYRYDLATGKLKNAITSGDYVVTELHHVDTQKGCLYFTAGNREPDRNPYYEHLYRVNLDGSELVLLTPENCQHDIVAPCFVTEDFQFVPNIHGVAPNGKVFIDTQSRVNRPPRSVLRSTLDGTELITLSRCEASLLNDTPYTPPLSFTTKATDGTTDLWGVIHRPSDFDEHQRYPVVLAIYGGPQLVITPKRFAEFEQYVNQVARTLAELGVIVVTLDPRGTPCRSKAFQDEIFGNYQNGGGIEDQIAALKQLSERYAWMDLNRVGITGHSSGGYAAARAMLSHPDFFKVAVSSAGAHDNRLYSTGWVESFQGLLNGDNFKEQANAHLAKNLKGKLLLIHGDMDANVHVAQTIRLVNELIEHNKNFDLLIMPNRNHSYTQDPYFIRRVWDYFAEYLLNETPPKDYCIAPPMKVIGI